MAQQVKSNTEDTQVNMYLSEIVVDLQQLIKIKGNNMGVIEEWLAEQNKLDGLAAKSTGATNMSMTPTQANANMLALSSIGIDPKTFGQSYADNMSIGGDGKLYNTGITEQTDKILGESRTFNADKPLVESAFTNDSAVPIYGEAPTVPTDYSTMDAPTLTYSAADMKLLSKPEFADYAGANNLDLNTKEGFDAAYKGFDANNESGDWGYKEWGTAGNLGLGAGQLGLGIASYFENKKTADAQRKLLGQQYASNAEAINDRRANKAALANIKIK